MIFQRSTTSLVLAIAVWLCGQIAYAQTSDPDFPDPVSGVPGGAPARPGEAPRFTYEFNLDYVSLFSVRRNYPFPDDTFQGDETFMWERLRPRLTVKNHRFDVVIDAQDTHSVGGRFSARKAWLDLLNAYVDVKPMNGWGFRLGRHQGDLQVISRMVRSSDFIAVVRSFDLAQVSWKKNSTDLRAFVFTPVENAPDRFNGWEDGELLWTTYAKTTIRKNTLQSYLIARHNTEATSETGVTGSSSVYAWEALASGPWLMPNLSWSVESVLERGHWSTDDVRAWALFLESAYRLEAGHDVSLRYAVMSGDNKQGDGERNGFDKFYGPSSMYGGLGLNRGSNLRSLSIGGGVTLSKPVSVRWRYFNSSLATRSDVWSGNFTRELFREDAVSSHLGQEIDLFFYYRVMPQLNLRFGFLKFFPGAYLETGPHDGPYEFNIQFVGRF